MKLISVLQASMAIRISPEDYIASPNPPSQDLVAAINGRYEFASINMGNPGGATVMMQGAFRAPNKPARSIAHMIFLQDGCIISSVDTDTTKEIFEDLSSFLVSNFGFRYQEELCKISYQSAVVVEFDPEFSEQYSLLSSMVQVISGFTGAEKHTHLKRISFAMGDPSQDRAGSLTQLSPIENIERAEYIIERRVGHPVEASRFFSTAPLQTGAHISSLEKIEGLVRPAPRKGRQLLS